MDEGRNIPAMKCGVRRLPIPSEWADGSVDDRVAGFRVDVLRGGVGMPRPVERGKSSRRQWIAAFGWSHLPGLRSNGNGRAGRLGRVFLTLARVREHIYLHVTRMHCVLLTRTRISR